MIIANLSFCYFLLQKKEILRLHFVPLRMTRRGAFLPHLRDPSTSLRMTKMSCFKLLTIANQSPSLTPSPSPDSVGSEPKSGGLSSSNLKKQKIRPQYGNGNIPPFHISINMLPFTQRYGSPYSATAPAPQDKSTKSAHPTPQEEQQVTRRPSLSTTKGISAKNRGKAFQACNSEVIFAARYSVSACTHRRLSAPISRRYSLRHSFYATIIY